MWFHYFGDVTSLLAWSLLIKFLLYWLISDCEQSRKKKKIVK